MFHDYFAANRTAGYSGFVVYVAPRGTGFLIPSTSYWMIPGTWEYDWDNQ
jgi:hypothetical protein